METDQVNKELWERLLPMLNWPLRTAQHDYRLLIGSETLEKLIFLTEEVAGEDDYRMLENLLAGHRSNDYVVALTNSLYAFKHLITGKRSDFPLCDLASSFRGLLPKCDRYHAVDFSVAPRYEESRPLLEAVMGVLQTGSDYLEAEFLQRSNDGSVVLKEELREIILQHPEKAPSLVALIRTRDFDRTNIKEIGELFDNAVTPLLEGTL